MMYAGRFKFLKIFHHHDFEKSLSKAVEAFKVWACLGNPKAVSDPQTLPIACVNPVGSG